MSRAPTAAELERVEAMALADAVDAMAAGLPPAERPLALRSRTATTCVHPDATGAFSRSVGLGLEGPADGAEVDAVLGFLASHTDRYTVTLSPQARPARLFEALLARGLVPGYPWMKFWRPVDEALPAAPSPPCAIRRVEGEAEGRAFAGLLGSVFGMESLSEALAALPGRPGWACFAAWDGDRAVGAGGVFVRDGVGWLGFGATHPGYRGRGLHRGLLRARIAAARELGAEALTVETGVREPGRPEASYRNLLWAGFREAYVRANLLSPALDQARRAARVA